MMLNPNEPALDAEELNGTQLKMVLRDFPYPTILRTGGEKVTAAALEKRGWGAVEDGASGERIFRLNQEGEDAVAFARKSWA